MIQCLSESSYSAQINNKRIAVLGAYLHCLLLISEVHSASHIIYLQLEHSPFYDPLSCLTLSPYLTSPHPGSNVLLWRTVQRDDPLQRPPPHPPQTLHQPSRQGRIQPETVTGFRLLLRIPLLSCIKTGCNEVYLPRRVLLTVNRRAG